jgi:hypothetical protein
MARKFQAVSFKNISQDPAGLSSFLPWNPFNQIHPVLFKCDSIASSRICWYCRYYPNQDTAGLSVNWDTTLLAGFDTTKNSEAAPGVHQPGDCPSDG